MHHAFLYISLPSLNDYDVQLPSFTFRLLVGRTWTQDKEGIDEVQPLVDKLKKRIKEHLTIIPRARMGCESMAHEAEGLMGYWLRGYEGDRNNCFSKIQLVGPKNREEKNFSCLKLDFNPFFAAKKPALFATSGL